MAGIYIKGLEIPQYCSACYCNLYHWCNLLDRSTTELLMTGRRFDDCPLIPVPDHGRLIEEDAAYDKIAEEAGEEAGNYVDMDVVGKGLEYTPTIIPADKET